MDIAKKFSLVGKIALVTGASGGLGKHFSETLAGAGATVAVGARRAEKVKEVVSGITATGGKAIAVNLDVSDRASIIGAFDEIQEKVGTVNICVNNAGISGRDSAFRS